MIHGWPLAGLCANVAADAAERDDGGRIELFSDETHDVFALEQGLKNHPRLHVRQTGVLFLHFRLSSPTFFKKAIRNK